VSIWRSLVLGCSLLVIVNSTAVAQTPTSTLRVTKDMSVIWRLGFSAPATVVRAGTQLDVVGRQGNWYEVIVPASGTTTPGMHGLIAANQVELIGGRVPPNLAPRPRSPSSSAGNGRDRGVARAVPASEHRAHARGFGEIGYGWMQAHQTFRAVFDQGAVTWWGAGAEYGSRTGGFVQGAFRRFHGTGERVFVFDDEVTKTGIGDTVTITPVDFTIGYRSTRGHGATYVGAGFGRYFYTETFDFADAGDKVKLRLTSYHVMAGYERRLSAWIATAFEVQYTHVPDALSGNVAEAFKESNMGGVEVRIRVAVGR